jgi:type III pantothenate kinase
MTTMLLMIDIGNSRSKWSIVPLSEKTILPQWTGAIAHLDLQKELPKVYLSIQDWIPEISSIIVCSVGPKETYQHWERFFEESLPKSKVLQFTSEQNHPKLINHYQTNKDLGDDRWAALFGGAMLAADQDFMVINCGTATTIDYVNAHGDFHGGWIVPGFDLMFKSLGEHTSNLPKLEVHLVKNTLLGKLGNSTSQAIQYGVLHAQLGAIQVAIKTHPKLTWIYLTGGHSPIVEPYMKALLLPHQQLLVEPQLIQKGLLSWFKYRTQDLI